MGRKPAITGVGGADIASGRAAFYDLLVAVFRHLPDDELLTRINSGDFQVFLQRCCELHNGRMDSGIALLNAYQSSIQGRPSEEVINELAVDRTRILRGTGHPDLKPPHEALYTGKGNIGDSVLEVRRFYRKSGLLPEDTRGESPDYLCVELDFMRQLCLREHSQWLSGEESGLTIMDEKEFLKEHLGEWVDAFCEQVEKHALTDFYRGLCRILSAFVGMERTWLTDLLAGRP